MKKAFALLLVGLLLATPVTAGRILQKELVATVDMSAAHVAYDEEYVINTKGQAYYVVLRFELTGGAGATNGVVVRAMPTWDRGVYMDEVLKMTVPSGSAAIDSIKVTSAAEDNVYLIHWGDLNADLPEGTYPPYISLQVREDYTAGTVKLYVYMVAR